MTHQLPSPPHCSGASHSLTFHLSWCVRGEWVKQCEVHTTAQPLRAIDGDLFLQNVIGIPTSALPRMICIVACWESPPGHHPFVLLRLSVLFGLLNCVAKDNTKQLKCSPIVWEMNALRDTSKALSSKLWCTAQTLGSKSRFYGSSPIGSRSHVPVQHVPSNSEGSSDFNNSIITTK